MADNLSFDEYQEFTGETITYPTDTPHNSINYCVLGLTGEAGEVAEKWKKVIRDNKGVLSQDARIDMALEVGDVLWYISRLAHHLGYTLEEVALGNRHKLTGRKLRNTLRGSGDNR